jgi:signal transduction histidine kinase/ActR/RegA family two-component response regulator
LGVRAHRSHAYRSALLPLIGFAGIACVLLAMRRDEYSDLHILVDTSAFLLSGVLALLLWSAGERLSHPLLRLLAVSFTVDSLLEFLHTLSGIEWSGSLEFITRAHDVLRPMTWPPAAYVLPMGIGAAIWLARRHYDHVSGFTVTLVLLAAALVVVFGSLHSYSAPGFLQITRPTLMPVPLLWVAVAVACWRVRATERLYPALALMAAALVLAHVVMLYSRAPHDTLAIVAHLGKSGGYLIALFSLVQRGSDDMLERIRAEGELARLNVALEDRVRERTAELGSANENYRQSQHKLASQLERLSLLDRITRAIGERQDLDDIYFVVLRELEDHLPIDFGCVCSYETRPESMRVARVGESSRMLAGELSIQEGASIGVEENGLMRCVRGELIYEPDIARVPLPFLERLAQAGLRSVVIAPLLADSKLYGALIATRRAAQSFSSEDCEFLRQLGEHIGLAVSQARMYTNLQRAYDELRQTTRTVMQQERLRALVQMASGIAHDINNALSPVSLYTESLLEHESGLSGQAREYLETIQRAIDDVGQTVARMRDFYRPREEQPALAPVELNALVGHVIELTRARWINLPQERGVVIEVETDLDPDLPAVQGASSEIRDALTNLIFNAVDAMPAGGTLSFRTAVERRHSGLERPSRYARVEVCDTGVGMDEETRRRCVEPFFTTKGERGTGLGLASVYGMLERHGGALEIESELAAGTTVRLRFPAVEATAMPVITQAARHSVARSLRILVVDDDQRILQTLRNTLTGDGHFVTAAEGGEAGVDAFLSAATRGEIFDVVITDLGMPHVDGRKVAASIAAASPGTPIILLTGWGHRLIEDDDVPAAVHRVLAKPPRLNELRRALSELMETPSVSALTPGAGESPTQAARGL